MTDPQYERFAPQNARRTDEPQPQIFPGETLGGIDPQARFAPPAPAVPVDTPPVPADEPVVPDIPVHQTPPGSPKVPSQFPPPSTKVNPQFNAAQREYAELLAQRRHSIDRVLQQDLEKLERFENAAQARRYKTSLNRARVVFYVGWFAWVPFAWFISSHMLNLALALTCFGVMIVIPWIGAVVFWRENNRRYRALEQRVRAQPSTNLVDERHSAFTTKQPPIRRW